MEIRVFKDFFASGFLFYLEILYIIHNDPLWEMPDSNPGPLPQKSGALPSLDQ